MAVLYPQSGEDFKTMVTMGCQPTTHIAVTDMATYIVMVPIVTSQHRHYIVLEADEDIIAPLLDWLKQKGYRIVQGRIEFKTY